MPKVTKAMLEADNAVLRAKVRKLETELFHAKKIVSYLDMFPKHISVMSISVERLTEALSHTIETLERRSK